MLVRKLVLTCLLFALLFAGAMDAQAQDGGPGEPSADEVNAIAKNLYCPVCESVPLDVCGTMACEQWRQQIADKLTEGYSDQQIYDFFVEQYGDRVLATPPARGLNWLVYVAPPLAILAGAWLYYRTLSAGRGMATLAEVQAPSKGARNDRFRDAVERELDERR